MYCNNKPLLNKNSLRTIEAQFVQKLKNNEARPKSTGSYLKKRETKAGTENSAQSIHVF